MIRLYYLKSFAFIVFLLIIKVLHYSVAVEILRLTDLDGQTVEIACL